MTDWRSAEAAIDILCRRWTLVVMASLSSGTKGHNELARATGLDNKCLSRALRHMRETGLVRRTVKSARPALRVNYTLTPRADELIVLLDALGSWHRESTGSEAPDDESTKVTVPL